MTATQYCGNAFYHCLACMSGKLCTKRPIGQPTSSKGATSIPLSNEATAPRTTPRANQPTITQDPKILPGQHFLMDFGFVQGKEYNIK
jgi:hypothetical protein